MTHDQVIQGLTRDLISELDLTDDLKQDICRRYITRALVIGIDHFHNYQADIIQMDLTGKEINRFKGVNDAARKLKIAHQSITRVLGGKKHQTHGFMFRKASTLKIA